MSTDVKTKNLTELGAGSAILTMALPATGTMMIEGLYHLVDTFWVGKLGATALAAASASAFILWMLFSSSDIVGVSTNTLVAQNVGAGRDDRIKDVVRRGIVGSLILGLVGGALVFPFRESYFLLLGVEVEVARLGGGYLAPWLLGLPVIMMTIVVQAAFRGAGDAKTPMLLMGSMVAFNAVLDPLLIFGWTLVPAFGLKGAAWASVFCHLLGSVAGALILKKRGLWPDWNGSRFFYVRMIEWWEMLRIGAPLALNGMFFSLTYIGLTAVIAIFGSNAIAAIGIGHRLESFPWFISYGFSVAAASLVGQYMGAGKPEEAARVAWRCSGIATAFIVVFCLVILLYVEPLIRFFIDDPEVVLEGSRYLRIAGICWIVGVLEVVLTGAFGGAGHSLPALAIGVPFTAIRIPMAYLLAVSLGMGVVGVWWAIGLSMVVKGLLIGIWFKRGGWKHSHMSIDTVSSGL